MSKKNLKNEKYVELARFLRRKREGRGLSQNNIAEALGFSSSQFVSNWERAISSPPMNSLPLLSRLLRIKEYEIAGILMRITKAEVRENFYKSPKRTK